MAGRPDCPPNKQLRRIYLSRRDRHTQRANFKEIINHEISECQEIVALFTPWSAQRFWVWVEVGAAWGQGKRIVAVLYGLSVTKLERIGGSRTVLEDINILDLNEFDRYLDELEKRVTEARDE